MIAKNEPTATVLVVDDDRIILDSLCEFLRLEGYQAEVGSLHSFSLRVSSLRPPHRIP